MRLRPLLLTAALLGAPLALAQLPVEVHPHQTDLLDSVDAALAANKKLVFDFWRQVVQAHDVAQASQFVADDLVQHSAALGNGRAALVAFYGALPRVPLKPGVDELVTIVAEGDRVVLGFRREHPDLANEGQTYTSTWFEMVRIVSGKIVEHWDGALKE